MTREEAISTLAWFEVEDGGTIYSRAVYIGIEDKIREALNMAISALEQKPCDDAISRDEAITAIRRAFSGVVPSNPSKEVREIFNKCKENLRELPSVTQKSGWIPVSERLPRRRYRCISNFRMWVNRHNAKRN